MWHNCDDYLCYNIYFGNRAGVWEMCSPLHLFLQLFLLYWFYRHNWTDCVVQIWFVEHCLYIAVLIEFGGPSVAWQKVEVWFIMQYRQRNMPIVWFALFYHNLAIHVNPIRKSKISSIENGSTRYLTHWSLAMCICVGKLNINGSNNGLLPARCQVSIWTSAGILLIGPLRSNFGEILIKVLRFSFKKMHLKMSSVKWQPSCLSLNVLSQLKSYAKGNESKTY